MLVAGLFVSCKKDEQAPELVPPKPENVEIGYANIKQAIRGRVSILMRIFLPEIKSSPNTLPLK